MHLIPQALTWRSDGGSAFGSLAGKRPNRESGDPLIRLPIFLYLLHGNMDKIFVDEALQAYRDSTGDTRPWQLLPVAVTSQILLDAQRRKSFRRGKFSQPTAAEGCVGS